MSVAVYIRVRVQIHPLVFTGAPKAPAVMFTDPQLSVAVAVPAGGNTVGLQPRFWFDGHEVNTGGVLSIT